MSNVDRKFVLPKRYARGQQSVWDDFHELVTGFKPLDLGQGFPDFTPSSYVIYALREVAVASEFEPLLHQYTRGYGHPRLTNVVAKLYSKLIGRELNPETEILITLGGYEALLASILGNVDEGDEVIIIEPFFDYYASLVTYAGGIPKYVPLRYTEKSGLLQFSADWVLNPWELQCAFNSKTKVIILNSPNNPSGKVYTLPELRIIADLCQQWNVICISDEVYEWFIYEPNKHIRMASLPGMWERTITIGSASKTFSVSGWRVGWAYCPANLMMNLRTIHKNTVQTVPTPLQEAVAIGMEKELHLFELRDGYLFLILKELEIKRDYMARVLINIGMTPTLPQGGFFMLSDWRPLESKINLCNESDKFKDYKVTKWMIKNIGIYGIPVSAFYSEENKALGENFVRYCFFKKHKNLGRAGAIFKEWKYAESCNIKYYVDKCF